MVEHLRSLMSKTIFTDGGLSLLGQGKFGWMLTDASKDRSNSPQVRAATSTKRVPPAASAMVLPRHLNTSTNFCTLLLDAFQRLV